MQLHGSTVDKVDDTGETKQEAGSPSEESKQAKPAFNETREPESRVRREGIGEFVTIEPATLQPVPGGIADHHHGETGAECERDTMRVQKPQHVERLCGGDRESVHDIQSLAHRTSQENPNMHKVSCIRF